mgnify:CR=1 FL=1
MTEHTPETLLKVAREVMPQDNEIWLEVFANKSHVVCEKVYSTYTKGEFFNPETNDSQFRALVYWCISNHCMPELFECPCDAPCPDCGPVEMTEYYTDIYGSNDELVAITAFTLVDCMIAAVAAKLEEKDCG